MLRPAVTVQAQRKHETNLADGPQANLVNTSTATSVDRSNFPSRLVELADTPHNINIEHKHNTNTIRSGAFYRARNGHAREPETDVPMSQIMARATQQHRRSWTSMTLSFNR